MKKTVLLLALLLPGCYMSNIEPSMGWTMDPEAAAIRRITKNLQGCIGSFPHGAMIQRCECVAESYNACSREHLPRNCAQDLFEDDKRSNVDCESLFHP